MTERAPDSSRAALPPPPAPAARAEVPLPPKRRRVLTGGLIAAITASLPVRVRMLLIGVIAAWGGFAIRNFSRQQWNLLAANGISTLLCTAAFVLVLFRPQYARAGAVIAAFVAVCGVGASAMFTGQGQSSTLWFLAVAPAFAGYLLGRRAAWIAAAGSVLTLLAVHLSARWIHVEPDWVIPASDTPIRIIVLTLLMLAFAAGTARMHQTQLGDLTRREETIEQLAQDLARQKDELTRARDEAIRASRAKGDFLAMMSHEIRTPLNAVLGLTGVLLDGRLDPEQRDLVRTIRTSGDALLLLLNDLLDFSKIEAGRLTLERAPFDVADSVEDALDLFATAAAEKGLDLSSQLAPDLPAVIEGDSARVRQILVNLLSNAVKFTLRGAVTVTVEARRAIADKDGNDLEIHCAVRDTGIGIPEDQLSGLFQPFSQVDASMTRRFGGTGLGLAICRALAERMGGRIWAESEASKGSAFHFSFRSREKHDTPTVFTVPDNDLTLFVIALPGGTRDSIVSQARALGLKPSAFDDTDSAREALAHERPDVVVADGSVLPQDLWLALDRMHVKPPVVVVSPVGRDSPARRALRAAWGKEPLILPTPVRRRVLRDAIYSLVGLDETPAPRSSRVPLLAIEAPLRVLVAEDNPVNQRVALLLLDKLGYRADVVGNGAEAVDAILARPYDLVLMDVRMPEVDGIEASRRIRAQLPPDRQPRIVALTANAMNEDREVCIAAGMDDFVSKPITAEELTRAVKTAAERAPRSATAHVIGGKEISTLRSLTSGSPELFSQIVDEYVRAAIRLVATIEAAAEKDDLAAVGRAAHSLKGSAGQMGAHFVAEACSALEQDAARSDAGAVRAGLLILRGHHEAALKKLRALAPS